MTDELVVRKTISVDAPPDRAFTVFARQMKVWWPLDYHVASQPAVDVIIEPMTGGRWYEQAADGSQCDWGRVIDWSPPDRLVLSWQISAEWEYDPAIDSEIEVRFVAEGVGRTRVDLAHRKLETFGERAGPIRDVFDSESGWTGLLRMYLDATISDQVTEGGRSA